DRACYVERAADAALTAAVRARQLCCVLGARGTGKSSLMHRAARRLRESGELVATVDLVQIGVLAERDSGRGWGLGVAERVGGERGSPFAAADVIELDDFSAAESYTLASGFGGEPEIAQALMDRVTVWTGGHPYLTQKVARSVIRKGGKLEDVERVVHEQLLA